MLPWNPPASLSMSMQQQQHQQINSNNEVHSAHMQHQAGQQQQQPQFGSQGQGQGQQQGQQQAQQGQMNNNNNNQMQGNGAGVPPNAVANGAGQQQQQPPITLSNVLHYLQTEWRRYERERNEWEIERGEMRARIALLEGERRGTENLKTDLMRRVKMLEYALRQERNKYLTSVQTQAAQAAIAQKDREAKEKARKDSLQDDGSKEGSVSSEEAQDKKEKTPAPAGISESKKKALAAAAGTSGRSSPAPAASEDGQSAAGSVGVPEVVVSSTAGPAASALPSHMQQQAQATNLHRAASTSSLISLPNGAGSTMNLPVGSTFGGPGGLPSGYNPAIGRDPRARAKSRDYLKQCLQEITYLTSVSALNPLPERTPGGLSRPRKELKDIALLQEQAAQQQEVEKAKEGIVDPNGNVVIPLDPAASSAAEAAPTSANASTVIQQPVSSIDTASSSIASEATTVPPSAENLPSAYTNGITTDRSETSVPSAADVFSSQSRPAPIDIPATSQEDSTLTADAASRLTAIFRPESSEEWKKALQKAGQTLGSPSSTTSSENGEDSSVGSTVSLRELQERQGSSTAQPAMATNRNRSDTAVMSKTDAGTREQESNEHKSWKPRRSLRSHLDATRCLAFDKTDRPADVTLVTGGDDCTVKLWRLPPQSVAANARAQHLPDSEPSLTYRGHTAPITSLCLSSSTNRVYSSSLDSTVQVWSIPRPDRETYAPFDASLNLSRLEGHTDGVWDVSLLGGASADKEVLASASSDGTVKIWDVSPGQTEHGGNLRLSWTAAGTEGSEAQERKDRVIPTSLALCQSDLTKLAVAYQDSLVRIFDTETGKLVLTLQSNEGYDGSPSTQINRIVFHPTLPMLMTAHENNYIRLFDLKSGTCTHSILAHSDAVTSLDVDPSGLTIASASHDCTIRFWDLLQTRSCIQEISNSHRMKGNEGILEIRYHPTLPYVASAGADGGVRIYG